MLQRALLLFSVILSGISLKAQVPVYHFFQTETPIASQQFKMAVEAVMGLDATAELFRSDDMTILQVRSISGLNEAAYRSTINASGIALRAGTPDLVALGLTPALDPNAPPVFVVSNDPAQDLTRYQAAVAEWNAAHPEQQISATPVHRQ